MSSGRCRKHGMFLVKPERECPDCAAYVADIRRIARMRILGPLCACGTPVTNARRHRIWHQAFHGEQFDLALYDKLMEARA